MTIADCEKYIAEGQVRPRKHAAEGRILHGVREEQRPWRDRTHHLPCRAADALEGKTGTVITR